jgi:hypothetical protein
LTKILNCVTLNDKTLFASDGPRTTKKYLEIIKEADYISDEDKKKLLGETGDWLLSADNEQFREFMFDLPKKIFTRMSTEYK